MRVWLRRLVVAVGCLYAVQLLAAAALWLIPIDERVEPDGTRIIYAKGYHPLLHMVPVIGAGTMVSPDAYNVRIERSHDSRRILLDVPLEHGLDSVRWAPDESRLIYVEDGQAVQ